MKISNFTMQLAAFALGVLLLIASTYYENQELLTESEIQQIGLVNGKINGTLHTRKSGRSKAIYFKSDSNIANVFGKYLDPEYLNSTDGVSVSGIFEGQKLIALSSEDGKTIYIEPSVSRKIAGFIRLAATCLLIHSIIFTVFCLVSKRQPSLNESENV